MMRISESYYGDFHVADELPFDLAALTMAAFKITAKTGVVVEDWPITIDYNEKTGFWEAWFGKPVSDEEYVEKMSLLSESADSEL